jgi:hypothetical protein
VHQGRPLAYAGTGESWRESGAQALRVYPENRAGASSNAEISAYILRISCGDTLALAEKVGHNLRSRHGDYAVHP